MKTLLPAAISWPSPSPFARKPRSRSSFLISIHPARSRPTRAPIPQISCSVHRIARKRTCTAPPDRALRGAPTDLALDNSAATAMGKEGVGGVASVKSAQLSAHSFTVTGWIKAEGDHPVGDGARLVEMVSPAGGFFVFGDAPRERWPPSSTATPSRPKRMPTLRSAHGSSLQYPMMAAPRRSSTTSAPRPRP